MMKKENFTKLAVTGILALTVVAAGVTMYRTEADRKEQKMEQEEQTQKLQGEETAKHTEESGTETEQQILETVPEEAAESEAEAADETGSSSVAPGSAQPGVTGEEQAVSEPAGETAEQTAGNQVENAPVLNFTEDTVISWPLQGSPVIDYSMDATVYFPTLDVYKYSPAMVLGAPEGTPVCAAAEGTVTGISEDAEIGTVMTVDVGNGYEMIYGQLKDVTVEEGQVLSEGEQLASVSAPTKYYAEEGSNLYFAMRKDGAPTDPTSYLAPLTE